MARNFELEKMTLSEGATIKAWTMVGSSVRGGGLWGWVKGKITSKELRFGKFLYYEVDGKRWVRAEDVVDAIN